MNEVFVVCWSGGYEAPSYAVFRTEEAAWSQAETWNDDADDERGDWIDVLHINLVTMTASRDTLTATRLYSFGHQRGAPQGGG